MPTAKRKYSSNTRCGVELDEAFVASVVFATAIVVPNERVNFVFDRLH